MKSILELAVTTNKGKRSHNEDNFVCKKKLRKLQIQDITIQTKSSLPCVCSVCDGMGGLSEGEKYSYLASNYIRKTMISSVWDRIKHLGKRDDISFDESSLDQRIQELNNLVYRSTSGKRVGGTTLAMLYITRDKILAANVGDSRIYTYKDSRLSHISMDHNDNFRRKNIWEGTDQRKNVLTQYIGISPQEMRIEPHIVEVKYEPMIFLLCSDGLTERLKDERIQQIILENSHKNCRELSQRLVEEAIKLGTKDNVTALIVKIIM